MFVIVVLLVVGECVFVIILDCQVLVFDVLDGCKIWEFKCFGELLMLVKVGVLMVYKDILIVG